MNKGFARVASDWRATFAFLRHYLSVPSALDWRVAVGSFSVLILGQAAMDIGRYGGDLAQWLLLALLVQAVVWLVLVTARTFVFSRPAGKWTPLVVIGVYAMAQVCRGSLAGLFVVSNLPHGQLELLYRTVFTLPAAVTTAIGWAVVVGARDEHRRLVADLEGKRSANIELRETLAERLADSKAELIREVRAQLAPSESELESALEHLATDEERRSAIARIQMVLERDIRPLSRSIESHELTLPAPVPPAKPRDVWPKSLRGTALFFPRATAAWLVGLNFSQVARVEFAVLPLALLALQGLAIWALVRLGESVLGRWQLRLGVGLAAAGVLTGFAAMAATQLRELLPHEEIRNLVPANFVAGFAVGFSLALFSAVTVQREQTEQALGDAVQALRVSTNLVEQRQWFAARRLRHVVHGALQGALVAAAIKLANAPDASEELVREIKADIGAALERLVSGGDDFISLEAGMLSLREAWRGVCAVFIELSPEAIAACDSDDVLGQCALEVAVEAVGNSIRHGKASKCEVSARRVGDLLRITVRDNGEGLMGRPTPGVGSRFFDEACLDWKLERKASRTVFRATFAIGEALPSLKVY